MLTIFLFIISLFLTGIVCYCIGKHDLSRETKDSLFWTDLNYKLLEREMETYEDAIDAIYALIEDSEGVYGLHMNGDLAPWEDLLYGGEYEVWLYKLHYAKIKRDMTSRNRK